MAYPHDEPDRNYRHLNTPLIERNRSGLYTGLTVLLLVVLAALAWATYDNPPAPNATKAIEKPVTIPYP